MDEKYEELLTLYKTKKLELQAILNKPLYFFREGFKVKAVHLEEEILDIESAMASLLEKKT